MNSGLVKQKSIKVAIVEDDARTRAALIAALSASDQVELMFETDSAVAMMAWIELQKLHPPDVLLVDLGLVDGTGFEVIRRARSLLPATDVLVVTLFGDEDNMIRAFEHGAKGYLLKDDSSMRLADHVVNLHHGGSPMSPMIARQLISRLEDKGKATAQASSKSASLTGRELDALKLISRGYTYVEVAKMLGVAPTTIHTHVRHIYEKLAVNNKAEAVFEARVLGLLN